MHICESYHSLLKVRNYVCCLWRNWINNILIYIWWVLVRHSGEIHSFQWVHNPLRKRISILRYNISRTLESQLKVCKIQGRTITFHWEMRESVITGQHRYYFSVFSLFLLLLEYYHWVFHLLSLCISNILSI